MERTGKVKNGKNRIKDCNCSEAMDNKYEAMPCDYGWHTSDMFMGVTLPKVDMHDRPIKVGNYVKNNQVSGVIKFFEEPMEFRVKVLNCRYAKDQNSIDLFYPTKIGRAHKTKWEVYTGEGDFEQWMNDFPKKDMKNEQ